MNTSAVPLKTHCQYCGKEINQDSFACQYCGRAVLKVSSSHQSMDKNEIVKMEKYGYLMVVWANTLMGKFINAYNEKGTVKTVKIGSGSLGELEFMSVINELGEQGWEMINFHVEGGLQPMPPFHIRTFFKKKISE